MDKLDAMLTFVTIVDRGSLTAAARALKKAQPTVVRSLALLEESLGVRLLARTTRRMSLTAEGESYLERCRQILADVGEAEALLQEESTELRGTIRLTAPVLFGQLRVAPAVCEFLKRHPGVKIDLVLVDRIVDLVEEGFDVGVRIASLEDSNQVVTKVGEVVRTCVASPDLLARVCRPQHPSELKGLPAVTLSEAGLGVWKFDDQGKMLRIKMDPIFVSNLSSAGIAACVEGLGFGQFLSYQVEDLIRQGRLVRLLQSFEPKPTPVHIVIAHARLLAARQRALLDSLKRSLLSSFVTGVLPD